MNNKFFKVCIFLSLLLLLSTGYVSAMDNVSTDNGLQDNNIHDLNLESEIETYNQGNNAIPVQGNFSNLNIAINTGGNNSIIELTGNISRANGENGFTNGIPINFNNVTINGNGYSIIGKSLNGGTSRIFNINGNNILLTNLTLINGYHQMDGGAIYNTGYLTISNVNFNNNKVDYSNGGAIYNSGNLTISNVSFFNNNNLLSGGGAVYNTANLTISNVKFTNNKADTYGGAIYNYEGNITINNGSTEFKFNDASLGGAIYNFYGSVIINSSKIDFINNTAGSFAGAIYNNYGNIIIANADFINNTAKSSAGAIYNNNGNITMNNTSVKFIFNYGNQFGSAIYNNNSILTINNGIVEFYNNYVTQSGAAIYINKGFFTVNNSTIKFKNNTAERHGGAIYNFGNIEFNNSNIDFIDNNANDDAGAIYNIKANIVVNGGTLEFLNNSAPIAGAIYNNAANFTINNGSINFKNNHFEYYGGAIYNDAGNFVINNGNLGFYNNTEKNNIGNNKGGAIYNYKGNFKINDGNISFKYNTANDGGVIYNDGSTFTINGGNVSFKYNTANDGGVIYNNYDSDFKINGGVVEFINNSAKNHGGAIYNHYGSNLNIIFSVFYNNTVGNTNETIYITSYSGNTVLSSNFWGTNNPKFKSLINNQKTYTLKNYIKINLILDAKDGMLYETNNLAYHVEFILNDTNNVINGNLLSTIFVNLNHSDDFIAQDNVNPNSRNITINSYPEFTIGLYYYDNLLDTITYRVSDYDFTWLNNTIYNSTDTIDLMGKHVKYNSTKDILLKNGIPISKKISIINGTVDGMGLARIFDISTAGNLTLVNVTLQNGTANNGGAIKNIGNVYIVGGTFINNNATGSGGAIHNDKGNVIIQNTDFYNNTANYRGGVIFNSAKNSFININNGSFINNTATNNGGVIYNNGDNITIYNGIFNNNTANNYGDVIFNNAYLNLSNSYLNGFSNNHLIYNSKDASLFLDNNTMINSNIEKILNYGNITSEIVLTIINNDTISEEYGNIIILNATLNDDNNNTIVGQNIILNNPVLGNIILDTYVNGLYLKNYLPSAGTFSISGLYNGGDNLTIRKGMLLISQFTPELNISVSDVDYGVNPIVNATLIGANGVGLNETVTITINGKEYNITISNGIGSETIDALTSGNYLVNATFNGNQNYTEIINDTVSFNVRQAIPELNITVGDVDYGVNPVINAILTGVNGIGLNGTVTITVNGKEYNITISNGIGSETIDALASGNYLVNATFNGNQNYTKIINDTVSFNVRQAIPELNIIVNDVNYGTNPIINVILTGINGIGLNGTVTITVNNNEYNITVINGFGSETIDTLPVNDGYIVNASFNGNENYTKIINDTVSFNVRQAIPELNVFVNDVDYGINPVVNVILRGINGIGLNGTVTITVNGKDYDVTVINGIGSETIDRLAAGSYIVNATVNGDQNYTNTNGTDNFNVRQVSPKLNLIVGDIDYGIKPVVNVYLTGVNGIGLNGTVSIIINGKEYNVTVINGIGNEVIDALAADSYIVNATFNGNQNYTKIINDTVSFNVRQAIPKLNITVSDVDYGVNPVINAIFTGVNGIGLNGTVTITVNGKEYNITISNGIGSETIDALASGNYLVNATFNGNQNYTKITNDTVSFNVRQAIPSLNIIVSDVEYGVSPVINAILTGTNGINLNGTVNIVINGKEYNVTVINGIGSEIIDTLAVNNGYIVNATFNGNQNYTKIINDTVSFNVRQAIPELNIIVNDVDYGVNPIIKIILTGVNGIGLNGTVNIVVGGKEYNVTVINGIGSETIDALAVGNYIVNGTFNGNQNYTNANDTVSFNVRQVSPRLDLVVGDVDYGVNPVVDVILIGVNGNRLNGTVSILVNGKEYNVTVINGFGSEAIDALASGNYLVNATFNGNQNYTNASDIASFNVRQISPELNIIVGDVDYGVNPIINASLTGINGIGLNGTVIITVNGKEYNVTVINGVGSEAIDALASGNYLVNATFNGNQNYTNASDTASFNVRQINPELNIMVYDVNHTVNPVVDVFLTGLNGIGLNGIVTITVNGKEYNVTVINGFGNETIDVLDVGSYIVNARFNGNQNYSNANDTARFNVKEATPILNISIEDLVYGVNPVVDVSLSGINGIGLNGTVAIAVGGKEYNVTVINGVGSEAIDVLASGNYIVDAIFNGNQNYTNASDTARFNVKEATPVLNISIKDVDYGVNPVVDVSLIGINGIGLNGIVTIVVNDKEYNISISNGIGSETIDVLASGNYIVDAIFNGNQNYTNTNDTVEFNVYKINSSIKIIVTNVIYGNYPFITINLTTNNGALFNTTLKGNIDLLNVSFNLIDGYYAGYLNTLLNASNYTISLTFIGNANYSSCSNFTNFEVKKANISTFYNEKNMVYGENQTIIITINQNITGNLVIIHDGIKTEVSIINNKATFSNLGLSIGKHNITIYYPGNNNYNSYNESYIVNIAKSNNFNINLENDTITDTLVVNVNPELSGNITLNLNGKNYTGDIINGTVKFNNISLNSGNYNATLIYSGNDNYNSFNQSINFNVIDDNGIILTADNVLMYFRNGTKFIVLLNDIKGNPIADQEINIIINGISYIRTTDINGTIKMNINLNPGYYSVIVSYNGSDKYNNLTIYSNLTVLSILEGNDISKYYKNGTQYTVKVLDNNGFGLRNAEVTFNINGVFYKRTSNGNGIATLNINLYPGNYTITVTFNGLNISNHISVLPTLIANDLVKNFDDDKTYDITVLNNVGNPFVNQNITINIHGVFYNRTTGNEGIARLNINLDPGSYIATVTWNEYSTSNNITVKS